MRRSHLISMVILAGILLKACVPKVSDIKVTPKVARESPKTFVYRCDREYVFTARLKGKEVWLFLPNKTVSLPQIASASGAKYSDGEVLFWSKGEEALLELSHMRYNCHNDRKTAIWEAAKLDGYDFRAVGNEPGWHLVVKGDQIDYVGDHGSTHQHFSGVQIDRDNSTNKTIYSAGEMMTLTLESKLCQDTMIDESYETTVTLLIDGKRLQGCGKALH